VTSPTLRSPAASMRSALRRAGFSNTRAVAAFSGSSRSTTAGRPSRPRATSTLRPQATTSARRWPRYPPAARPQGDRDGVGRLIYGDAAEHRARWAALERGMDADLVAGRDGPARCRRTRRRSAARSGVRRLGAELPGAGPAGCAGPAEPGGVGGTPASGFWQGEPTAASTTAAAVRIARTAAGCRRPRWSRRRGPWVSRVWSPPLRGVAQARGPVAGVRRVDRVRIVEALEARVTVEVTRLPSK